MRSTGEHPGGPSRVLSLRPLRERLVRLRQWSIAADWKASTQLSIGGIRSTSWLSEAEPRFLPRHDSRNPFVGQCLATHVLRLIKHTNKARNWTSLTLNLRRPLHDELRCGRSRLKPCDLCSDCTWPARGRWASRRTDVRVPSALCQRALEKLAARIPCQSRHKPRE